MGILDRPDPTFDCAIDYDATVPCVTMVWKGHATSAQFRSHNEQVLDVIKERSATKLLCDARDFVLIGGVDQTWLASDWIPRALQTGIGRAALVMPRFYFNRVAIESVSQRIAGEVSRRAAAIEYFETRPAARVWLSAW